ncbi:MAG: helix-hairpin-helix domain-containing protein [Rhodospirillales bacterium]|nr:MAG: helix-hairpin-helix domain-containing protein [Rhodospirillales bacterium]
MPIPKAGTAPKPTPGKPAPKATACPDAKVNVNTATLDELRKLPQIGPQRANAIIKARPYAAPEDILKRKVLKKQVFDRIKACIVAPPAST